MTASGQLAARPARAAEDPAFLQEQILTYIGNKRALLGRIGEAVETVRRDLRRPRLRTLDLFSGSGIVARFLKRFSSRLVVNDLERYSEVTNRCYLANASNVPMKLLEQDVSRLSRQIDENLAPGFITELYAPRDERAITPHDRVFYTRRNAMYLDTARRAIETVPESRRHFLLAPLLAEASVHANTSGVFKGFYKSAGGVGQFGGSGRDALTRILGEIRLTLPVFSRFECDVEVCREDANTLVGRLGGLDLAYLDPPYNQHPYGSNYFMLNLLAEYRRPTEISRVSGIPRDWQRSRYNQRGEAEAALFDVIAAVPARFVLISYNSEGFIPQERFAARLARLGEVRTFETAYNTFRGSRNLRGRSIHVTEFLYLLRRHA